MQSSLSFHILHPFNNPFLLPNTRHLQSFLVLSTAHLQDAHFMFIAEPPEENAICASFLLLLRAFGSALLQANLMTQHLKCLQNLFYKPVPSIHSVFKGNILDCSDSSFKVLVEVTQILILFLSLQSIAILTMAVFILPPLGDDVA